MLCLTGRRVWSLGCGPDALVEREGGVELAAIMIALFQACLVFFCHLGDHGGLAVLVLTVLVPLVGKDRILAMVDVAGTLV